MSWGSALEAPAAAAAAAAMEAEGRPDAPGIGMGVGGGGMTSLQVAQVRPDPAGVQGDLREARRETEVRRASK